jgi:transposase InsO family protein
MVRRLASHQPDWSKRQLCAVLDVPRSSVYYRSQKQDETPLRDAIQETAGQWPRYGSERITRQMRREGITFQERFVGERRVRRVMRAMGLLAKVSARKVKTTDSAHAFPRFRNLVEGIKARRPDHIWVSDITYIRLGNGFVYLAVILDVFTRTIRGWFLSRRLDGDLTLLALERALARGTPEIHHSDQGVQYAATDYVQKLQAAGVAVSMASVGCPEENGYAERWMRTLKEEHISLTEYLDFADALVQIGHFIEEVYQRKRIHSSLGYLTPVEFETQWRQAQQQ